MAHNTRLNLQQPLINNDEAGADDDAFDEEALAKRAQYQGKVTRPDRSSTISGVPRTEAQIKRYFSNTDLQEIGDVQSQIVVAQYSYDDFFSSLLSALVWRGIWVRTSLVTGFSIILVLVGTFMYTGPPSMFCASRHDSE